MVRDPRPRIAVLGATGAQGGSLARALLAGGRHAVRAITRHPGSPAGQDLELDGAELVAADLDDPASLRAAFEGAQGLFAVTPSAQAGRAERAYEQARHIADAARDAGVAHVVWSTQEDTRRFVPLEDERLPTLGGRWKVPSFDARGAANALFRERGLPTTLLHAPFYWDELLRPEMAQRVADPAASRAEVVRSTCGAPGAYRPTGPNAPSELVTPGDPARSVLVQRMRTRVPQQQMPPLGTRFPDPESLTLIERWIANDTHP